MALKPYQTQLVTGTLYAVASDSIGKEQLLPNICVTGGTCTIYGSQAYPGATNPQANMATTTAMTNFTGIDAFGVIPNYLYITGNATSIIVSGLSVITNPTS